MCALETYITERTGVGNLMENPNSQGVNIIKQQDPEPVFWEQDLEQENRGGHFGK